MGSRLPVQATASHEPAGSETAWVKKGGRSPFQLVQIWLFDTEWAQCDPARVTSRLAASTNTIRPASLPPIHPWCFPQARWLGRDCSSLSMFKYPGDFGDEFLVIVGFLQNSGGSSFLGSIGQLFR